MFAFRNELERLDYLRFFASKHYKVTGSDLSPVGLEFTKNQMKKDNLDARLVLCPMTNLPFKNSEFDVTVSRATINHASLQDMKRSIYEAARTTRKDGLFFITFI